MNFIVNIAINMTFKQLKNTLFNVTLNLKNTYLT